MVRLPPTPTIPDWTSPALLATTRSPHHHVHRQFVLSTLYRQASVVIFDLIATDSFRRFLVTREFALLLDRANEAEIARMEKQTALQDTSGMDDHEQEQKLIE